MSKKEIIIIIIGILLVGVASFSGLYLLTNDKTEEKPIVKPTTTTTTEMVTTEEPTTISTTSTTTTIFSISSTTTKKTTKKIANTTTSKKSTTKKTTTQRTTVPYTETATSLRNEAQNVSNSSKTSQNEMLRLVNEYRVSQGLNELTLNEDLNLIATIRSLEIGYYKRSSGKALAHERPNGGYVFGMEDELGLSTEVLGENLYWDLEQIMHLNGGKVLQFIMLIC